MTSIDSVAVAAIVAAGAPGLLASASRRSPTTVARCALAGAAVTLACAVALVVGNISAGPARLVSESAGGQPTIGIEVDRVASILFLLVATVLVTAQGFASRQLLGDPKATRFHVLCGLMASATLVAASAITLSLLTVAWCIAGALLCLMLLHRSDLAEARKGARRTAMTFAVGDGALVLATVLILGGGELDLRDPVAAAASLSVREVAGLPLGAVTALLLGTCVLARSAQFPMHRWLPGTLAAPTPVSAMLHAGLVNGGGLLMIVLAPLLALEPAVLWILLAAGLATTLIGTAAALVRTDAKGSLAWSTTAQMGFMVAQCATGGFAAALLHMFGHGIYKANLFLGAGGAVAGRSRSIAAPHGGQLLARRTRIAVAALLPSLLLLAALALLAPDLVDEPGVPILLCFALATSAHATWSWLSSAGSLGLRSIASAVGLLAACTGAYVAAIAAFEGFVADELPAVSMATPQAWILLAAIGFAAAAVTALRVASSRSETTRRIALKAWALAHSAAEPTPAAARRRSRPAPESTPSPRPATIGATR